MIYTHSADDITIDYSWRHNDQTIVMRATKTWYQTRYLDIDFIHGDIHDRS